MRRRWVLGRSRCSYPPHTSWHRRGRSRGRAVVSFRLFHLSISLVRNNLSGGPGGEHKGSLQRAVTARTADRKTGQNVRRHDLDRSYASMIKQKKKKTPRPPKSW